MMGHTNISDSERMRLSATQVFDLLSQRLASGIPRRRAFSLMLKGIAGAVLAEFGMQSAWSAPSCLCGGATYDAATHCCISSTVLPKYPMLSVEGCPGRVPHPRA